MDVMQLAAILARGENQEVEFKESFHSQQDVSKTLCAFANTQGGVLFFGIDDKGGVKGIKESADSIQQKISNANQAIHPAPSISIELVHTDHHTVVLAIIQRAPDQSYHTFQGAIYVRVGSTTKRLEGEEHRAYLRHRNILSFEDAYESTATIEDIDEKKVAGYLAYRGQRDYLAQNSVEEFLLSTRLATKIDKLHIKNAALLLFAKHPERFIPQIEVRLAQFPGNDPTEPIATSTVLEDLPAAIASIMTFIKKNTGKQLKLTGEPQREEHYEYPLTVIREAVVNAIGHRDYYQRDAVQVYLFKDYMTITNPGSLPQALPRELFGTISVQRNPVLYRFLRDLGFVEGLGIGVPRMKNEMRKAHLYDPEFGFFESFFRVTLHNKHSNKRPIENATNLNDRQRRAITYLAANKTIKTKTYGEINQCSSGTANNDIRELIEYGYLKKIGVFRGAYYTLKEKN